MFEDFGWHHLVPIAKGAWFTVVLCFFSIILGGVIGLLLGLGATSDNRWARWISAIYINLIRGIPLLIIIFFIYFALPLLVPGMDLSKEVVAVIALSVYAGAYMGEIVRGCIQSIHKGQFEAADALGMSYFQKYRYIIVPQAMKVIVPPGIGFIIALVKDSSLVSTIGFIDLTKAGRVVSNLTVDPLKSFLAVAVFYFIICYALSRLAQYYEAKMARTNT
ncbi:amino acid ABC transporter permease [Paenibacillus sp. NPDC057967]|uniref:amino acid ABC transporter permease n=1 Tax=Paenibacillus sp. NPDC057967 TaxID=3346293 RepID=UPI0036DE0F27